VPLDDTKAIVFFRSAVADAGNSLAHAGLEGLTSAASFRQDLFHRIGLFSEQ
jgi:hypothetical protein